MKLKYTNEFIDSQIEGRNIKRLDNSVNGDAIKWQCIICDNIWSAKPFLIIKKNSGCRVCASNSQKLSIDYIDLELEKKSIKRLSDYINARSKMEFKCLKNECSYTWTPTLDSVLSNNKG